MSRERDRGEGTERKREKEREKKREREREKKREREREREKERERKREKERERKREREREEQADIKEKKRGRKSERKTNSPRAVPVGDLPHARVVVVPRVRRRPGHDALGPEQAGRLLELAVVDQARALVEAVGHRLEEDRRRRDALGVGLVAVREVAAVGEVEAHDAVVRVEQGGVDLVEGEGGRRAEEEEEEQGGREVEREKRNRARAFFRPCSLSLESKVGVKRAEKEKKTLPLSDSPGS